MSINVESESRVYFTLKSLFRYSKLVGLKAPEVLFETERELLKKRMSVLMPDELYMVVTSWETFNREQTKEDEIQDKKLDEDLKDFYKNVN